MDTSKEVGMKLIDLMVVDGIEWPAGFGFAAQDAATRILYFYQSSPKPPTTSRWVTHIGAVKCVKVLPELAEDWDYCIVTKGQYDTVVRLANKAKAAEAMSPPEHPDVVAFKKWYAETLPVVEAQAAGKVVEGSYKKMGWFAKTSADFHTNATYRIKPEPPKTININGYDVPEPLRVAPPKGTPVYVVGVYSLMNDAHFKWDGGTLALQALEAGMMHLTREAAELHTQALLSFTQEGK